MGGYTSEELQAMVRPDRVHRAIYTDPAIFEIEMEKIFRRVWLYVGHESLVPNPGDYYCTQLARQPVVLSRHADDGICVLFNRCGHRGARVLSAERGNAKVFTCMYHGWSFRPNGALAGVPMRADFPEEPLGDPHFRHGPTAAGRELPRLRLRLLQRRTPSRCWTISPRPGAASTSWWTARRRARWRSAPAATAITIAATGSCSSRTWRTCTTPPPAMRRPSAPTAGSSSAAPGPRAGTRRSSPPTARPSSPRPACAA